MKQRPSFDVAFNKETNEQLYKQAELEGRSVQAIVREATLTYLSKQDSGETTNDQRSNHK